MSKERKIDEAVLLAMARIQAALELVPHLVGPTEAWVPWMRDQLQTEVVSDAQFVSYIVDRSYYLIRSDFPHPPSTLCIPGFWEA